MNTDEIRELIKLVSKAGIGRVEIERDGFYINIEGGMTHNGDQPIYVQAPQTQVMQTPAAVAPQAAISAPASAPAAVEESNAVVIKSTMIGTFYRSSGPDKDAFVSVGSMIQKGDKICIIEAMKLFNEIEAEISGKIVKILVDDASPVEYDQPLFLVEPA
jgi:acetyl-CoA carboxylase biotin carboxyl carrier protein